MVQMLVKNMKQGLGTAHFCRMQYEKTDFQVLIPEVNI